MRKRHCYFCRQTDLAYATEDGLCLWHRFITWLRLARLMARRGCFSPQLFWELVLKDLLTRSKHRGRKV
jgi:hypothetical protein